MRSVNLIKQWCCEQTHLYFVFVVLSIIPNLVLFFTEPLPVFLGLSAVILPMSVLMLVLLLASKPGIVMWFLVPKVILDGGQLVLL